MKQETMRGTNGELTFIEEAAPLSLEAFQALDINEIEESSYTQEISEEKKQNTLKEVADLCAQAEQLNNEVKAAEAAYLEKKDSLDKLMQGIIPETLESVGLKELKLSSGKKISVVDDCRVSISNDRRSDAMSWLRENEFDDIIKNQVTTTFSKGDDAKAIAVYRDLLSQGFDVNHKEDVHPATLKAFIKEQIKKSALSSEDKQLFGVFEFKIAKIK